MQYRCKRGGFRAVESLCHTPVSGGPTRTAREASGVGLGTPPGGPCGRGVPRSHRKNKWAPHRAPPALGEGVAFVGAASGYFAYARPVLVPIFSNFGRAFDRFRRSALRQSAKLLTAQDIAQHAMAGRGLNTSDKRLVRLVGKRVGLDIPTVNAVMRANVRSPQSRDEGVAANVPATSP